MPGSFQEQNTELRTLLREAAATHQQPSRALAAWWAYEQQQIAEELRIAEARKSERRAELLRAIEKLTDELESL
jgi:hypothetical protein